MWTVRPIATRDLDALISLATSVGPGMTTLPADEAILAAKIAGSVASFASQCDRAEGHYLMVLEDGANGEILGTAALYPHVGAPYGFFSYKRLRLVQRSRALGVACDVDMLSLSNDYTGSTEVGTLAIRPELKGTGAGRLLARSRYMLAAEFPDLFAPLLMAEMRGWQNEAGASPFWDAVGAQFFDMDFASADRISAMRGSEFIAELLPKHPIYANLLPPAAREAIGRPHRDSAPAMAMLRAEGFRYEGFVDVFDAGPQMHCERGQIETVRSSRSLSLSAEPMSPYATPDAPLWLVCTGVLDRFRVVATPVVVVDGTVSIPSQSAEALGAQPGDMLRISPGRPASQ